MQPAVEDGKKTSQEANVTPLMSKPLPDFPGKEVLMITVTYPPGGSDPVHKHNAHGFIYVLEGSIVMGVKGGKPVTLTPGRLGGGADRTLPLDGIPRIPRRALDGPPTRNI